MYNRLFYYINIFVLKYAFPFVMLGLDLYNILLLYYGLFLICFRDLQSYLGIDYGPSDEYSVLKGNCYEYTDREYTYKMCAFDKATQRPKSGGHETTLG